MAHWYRLLASVLFVCGSLFRYGFRIVQKLLHPAVWYVPFVSFRRVTMWSAVPIRTPNPPTNIVDFTGFDSSTILIKRSGIPRVIGNFPESLSQAM